MAVKLFFPPISGPSILSSEQRTIFKSGELTNRAKQLLKIIIDGPLSKELLGAMPKDTKLQEVFVSKDGILFVDFSSAISVNHPGGIINEQATIYSIVDSLLYNLPEIHQVKILIGGTEQETLAGHCLLLLPLEMDLSITGEEEGTHAN
jgi:spore germination protein GerM